jgi:hypothetical protein
MRTSGSSAVVVALAEEDPHELGRLPLPPRRGGAPSPRMEGVLEYVVHSDGRTASRHASGVYARQRNLHPQAKPPCDTTRPQSLAEQSGRFRLPTLFQQALRLEIKLTAMSRQQEFSPLNSLSSGPSSGAAISVFEKFAIAFRKSMRSGRIRSILP